jgi:hypothetical protein
MLMMTSNQHEEHWRELCEAIVREPDSERLMKLVEKLNRILEEREGEKRKKTTPLQSEPTFGARDA